MLTVSECAKVLADWDNILLITHRRPDGDTVGSAAALCRRLHRLGKKAYMFANPGITDKYRRFAEAYLAPPDFVPEYTLAVDVASDGMFPDGYAGKADMSIDHHPSNSGFAGEMTLCMPEKASCGEVILLILKELDGEIDKEEADLLYTAVSTDTGCFVYANTTHETHLAAAELMAAGADTQILNKELFRTFSKSRLTLEGMIYTGITQYCDGKINVAKITMDMMEKSGATEDDCDDLASLAGRVAGGLVSITIREIAPGRSKVSMRSGTEVNSNLICGKFGGGGHAMAAGCTVDMSPESIEKEIVAAIEEIWD